MKPTIVLADKTVHFGKYHIMYVEVDGKEKAISVFDSDRVWGEISIEPAKDVSSSELAEIVHGAFDEASNFFEEAKKALRLEEYFKMKVIVIQWHGEAVLVMKEQAMDRKGKEKLKNNLDNITKTKPW